MLQRDKHSNISLAADLAAELDGKDRSRDTGAPLRPGKKKSSMLIEKGVNRNNEGRKVGRNEGMKERRKEGRNERTNERTNEEMNE